MVQTFQLPAGAAGSDSDDTKGSIFFVGTATVIISYAGFTILSDPNFLHAGDHVHLGYGLTSERALRLYISGDTLVIDELREIPKRFPEIDIGLIHLGGTRVPGILVTMDDREGVEALKIVQPETMIPIHYNDYDVFKAPLEDSKRAAEEADLSDRIVYLAHGETYNFEVPAGNRRREVSALL